MFCPKCGASLGGGARFCSKCGHALPVGVQEPAPVPSPQPVPVPQSIPAPGGMFTIANIVLVAAAFLPWLSVNVYVVSGQFSLLDFGSTIFRIDDQLRSFMGPYYYSEYGTWVGLAAVVGVLMFFAMIITNGFDAISGLRGKRSSCAGFVVSLTCGIVALAATFAAQSMIGDVAGSYFGSSASAALSGMVSATAWPWMVTLGSAMLLWLKAARDRA